MTMKIQIYGSGCAKCEQLTANAEAAIRTLGIDCEVEKVTAIDRIVEAGVLITPALAIDGVVVGSGKVLAVEAIAELLAPGGGNPVPAAVAASKAGGTKKYLTWLLLLFVLASVAWAIVREARDRAPVSSPPSGSVADGVLTVYYFHGNQRCMTCNRIEALARAAIEEKFPREIAGGRVVFRAVNVDEPANEHFIRDFQLASRTVVMADGGKYEKFDEVWTLVGEPEKFAAYLQQGAAEMMKRKD